MSELTPVHVHDASLSIKDRVSSILYGSEFEPIFDVAPLQITSTLPVEHFIFRLIPAYDFHQIDDSLERFSPTASNLIIMYSENNSMPTAVHAIKCGAFDFLETPFNKHEFIGSLQRALDFDKAHVILTTEVSSIASRVTRLTLRENTIINLILAGKANKIIAHELAISQRTVENHRASIMRKMDANSITHLVNMMNKISNIV